MNRCVFKIIFLCLITAINGFDVRLMESVCHISICTSTHSRYIYMPSKSRDTEFFRAFFQCLNANGPVPVIINILNVSSIATETKDSSLHLFFLDLTNMTSVQEVTQQFNKRSRNKKYLKYVFTSIDDVKVNGDLRKRQMEKSLTVLFQQIWSKNILNAIAIWPNWKGLKREPMRTYELKISTFEPFSSSGFKILHHLSDIHCSQLFYDKLQNWNQQKFNISMFNDTVRAIRTLGRDGYYGVDGNLALHLFKKLNVTVNYISPADGQRYGNLLKNGTFTGSLKDMYDGLTELGLNVRFTLDNYYLKFEQTYPYHFIDICLVTPNGKPIPPYLNIFLALKLSTWMLIVSNYVIAVAIYAGLQCWKFKINNNESKQQRFRIAKIAQIFFKTLINDPINVVITSNALRIFLISWIIFSYILTVIYFGKLESTYVEPSYQENLDKLLPAVIQSDKIFGSKNFLTQGDTMGDKTIIKIIKSKFVSLKPDFQEEIFHWPKTFTYLNRLEFAQLFLLQTYDVQNNRPAYHIVKEPLYSVPVSYVLNLGSPYVEKIDTMVTRYREYGFIQFWDDKTKLQLVRKSLDKGITPTLDLDQINEDDNEQNDDGKIRKITLTLNILQSSFYMWLIGVLISAFIFLVEVLYYFNKLNIF